MSSELAKRMGGLCFWAAQIAALYRQNVKTGEIGKRVPALSARDQEIQSLKSITGPKGAVLVFFRLRGLVTVL